MINKILLITLSACLSVSAQLQHSIKRNVLIHLETIEVNKGELEKLIAEKQDTGTQLRKALQTLLQSQQAQLKDSTAMLLTAGEERRSRVLSAGQFIYPTEYEPDKFHFVNPTNGNIAENKKNYFSFPMANLTAWEERPAGSLLEMKAHVSQNTISLDLEYQAERFDGIKKMLNYNYKNANFDVAMPKFTRHDIKTSLSLTNNQYQLISYGNPVKKDGKIDLNKIVATFVRASVRTIN